MNPRLAVLCLLTASAALPQKLDPAQWTLTLEPAKAAPGAQVLARLSAKLESPWHLYAFVQPKDGAQPTKAVLAENAAVGDVEVFQPNPIKKFDPNFNVESEFYEGEAAFLLKLSIKKDAPAGPAELTFNLRYQVCTDTQCLPKKKAVTVTLAVDPAAAAPAIAIPAGYSAVKAKPAAAPQQDLASFLLVAFGFGLAALFTPCVFPMIPFTISAFSKNGGFGQAVVFCLGIIGTFTGIGFGLTAALGPFAVVQAGSNPWVNGFIALVFLMFGLSLLGAFEITLPASLTTSLSNASDRGGYLGSLLMGLTFSLTSFACVGPFVGTLLAASVQGGKLQPVLGMIAFSAGLSLPFFLLAMFPVYLQKLPRSGGWLARVKVVMGFVIVAMMFKYLSNVDQVLQSGILTRERFLALWFVFFSLPGLYLLGLLRLEGIKRDDPMGVGRLFAGAMFLAFALSLLPGMFGVRLGDLESFIPAPTTAAAFGGGGGGEALAFKKNQYREALDQARKEGKKVFADFTGYSCSNCKWMKANMFPKPEVTAELKKFVLVELYTDGTDAASEANQQLQEKKFSTVAIPFYAVLDPDEKVIATFAGLTRNQDDFVKFLRTE